MAQLTPLAKGLITVIILGGTGAAAWHLGLRDLITREPAPAQPVSERAGPKEPDRKAQAPEQEARTDVAGSGLLGSRSNPLRVSLVSFHGYAPALLANGLSLTTKPGSIFAQKGVAVEFILQDDIPTLSTIFESGAAHCAWRTATFGRKSSPICAMRASMDARSWWSTTLKAGMR